MRTSGAVVRNCWRKDAETGIQAVPRQCLSRLSFSSGSVTGVGGMFGRGCHGARSLWEVIPKVAVHVPGRPHLASVVEFWPIQRAV